MQGVIHIPHLWHHALVHMQAQGLQMESLSLFIRASCSSVCALMRVGLVITCNGMPAGEEALGGVICKCPRSAQLGRPAEEGV